MPRKTPGSGQSADKEFKSRKKKAYDRTKKLSAKEKKAAEDKAAKGRNVAVSGDEDEEDEGTSGNAPPVGLAYMFGWMSRLDSLLLLIGVLSALAQGGAMPAFSLVFAEQLEALNRPDPLEASQLTMERSWYFMYVSLGVFLSTTLNVACFEFVSQRQMMKYRSAFFEAVLRQDIMWFERKANRNITDSMMARRHLPFPAAAHPPELFTVRIAISVFNCRAATG